MLLAERHLTRHADFLTAYDRCAAQLDPPIPPGYGPAKTQYYQWLSGRMIGFPRDYHCRVLVRMFPGWTVEGLFQMADSASVATRSHEADPPAADIELEAFLGAEMITSGTTLVYPTLELTGRSVDALQVTGTPRRHISGKKAGAFPAHHRIDVPVALPENDIRGLLYVFSLLQRHTSIPTDVRSDRDFVAHRNRPYISFGLSGNVCTRMYLESVECPLFTVRANPAGDGPYPEHLELTDGSRYGASGDRNIGIVARVRPSPDLHPGRYWIYCAGLGPRGTAGASWYLANYWSLLQRRAGDHEFVAVVGVRKCSDKTATLVHLLIKSTD
jgi:hypothetical protein